MAKDLTKGNPIKLIITFMLPILLGNIVQQFYSIADAIIVGQTISTQALGGVGATGHFIFFIIGFSAGITAGMTVITSQCFGAGDREGVKRSVATSFVLVTIIAVVLTAIAVPITKPVLKLLDTPETLMPYSYNYLLVTFAGLSGTLFYNLLACLLRAIGDSKIPLFFLIVSSVLNIALDLFFILVFKLGVTGAALATVLSQIISALCCLVYMFKKYEILRFNRSHLRGATTLMLKKLRLGLPLGLGNSLCAIGLMVQQTLINGFGEVAVSSISGAYKIDNIFIQANSALGLAFVTYAGQNVGAGKWGRVKKGIAAGFIIAPVMAIVEIAIVVAFLKPIISLFIPSPSSEIMYYARNYMYIQAFTYIIQLIFFMLRNVLQGLGKSTVPMIMGVIETACRCVSVLAFASWLGFTAVSVSNPFAWMVVLIIGAIAVAIELKGKKDAPSHDNE